jgi:hypothetical protein
MPVVIAPSAYPYRAVLVASPANRIRPPTGSASALWSAALAPTGMYE